MLDVLKMSFDDVLKHFETYPSIRMVSETSYIKSICILSTEGLLLFSSGYTNDYYSHIRNNGDSNKKNFKYFLTDKKVFGIIMNIETTLSIEHNYTINIEDAFIRLERFMRKQKLERLLLV